MLKRILLMVLLLSLLLMNGFSQQTKSEKEMLEEILSILNGEKENTTALTWDIIKKVPEAKRKEIFKDLNYYLSSDIVLTSRPKFDPVPKSGKLEIDYGDTVTKIIISKTGKGKFKDYGIDKETNKEYFEIEFNEHKIKFSRNMQNGRFGNPEVLSPPDAEARCEGYLLPYLCIDLIEKGVTKPQSRANSLESQPQILNTRQIQGGSQRINQIQSRQNDIMGRGTLSRDVIVSYIYSRNSKPLMTRNEINVLVSEYINEAMREGVNHDIAIAQMCYATGFLSNNKILNTNNFGGLNTDKGISVKYGNRHAHIQEGVWAHIQHLKAYASCERPKREIVDMRYYLLADSGIIGTITTLDSLFATWAPYNYINYGNDIRRILNEMYRLSNRNI